MRTEKWGSERCEMCHLHLKPMKRKEKPMAHQLTPAATLFRNLLMYTTTFH